MKRIIPTILAFSMMLAAAMIGLPTSAKSQTIIIIGNGSAHSNPRAYAAPYYGYGYASSYAPGYSYGYAASGYYPAYGYHRPYGWGYRSWGW